MKKITKEYVKGTIEHDELTVISPPTVPEYIYDFGENGENSNDFFSFMNNTDNKPIRTLILMQYGYYIAKEVE
ncbi:TPA_asm: hypothetical protein GF822_14980 [Listeria monocytogenes]|nr:hypothetical protein [Listeria monocytogenes]